MRPVVRRMLASLLCLCLPAVLVGTARSAEASTIHVGIEFDAFSQGDGLSLMITTRGDEDGRTTFSNHACCGRKDAHGYVADVRASVDGKPVEMTEDASGWTVTHAPGAELAISYRLPPSGDTMIDTGLADQTRPIVDGGAFQLMSSTALLLPIGHHASEVLDLDVDASRILEPDKFVSSFGSGNVVHATASRYQVDKALFMGGRIELDVVGSHGARLGIAYSGLDPAVRGDALREDAIAIVGSARAFFHDAQPWYLVSVRGGKRRNPKVHIGGGTGKTNAFAMFVRSDLDFDDAVQREQFRWVLAHEYFHQWNGLTLRVAPLPGGKGDDASIYWFSEGFTEFYTMRLLTRSGLQAPARSIKVLDSKLAHYDANSKRDLDAVAAAKLFWSSDRDGEQIPYLRGYLAAWYADLSLRRASGNHYGLDEAMRELVERARQDPGFRVTTAFLVDFLGQKMRPAEAKRLERFVVEGGKAPFGPDSFAPCLAGGGQPVSGRDTLQFHFADPGNETCFRH